MNVGTVATHPMIELRRLHRYFGSTRAVDDACNTGRGSCGSGSFAFAGRSRQSVHARTSRNRPSRPAAFTPWRWAVPTRLRASA